MALGKVVSTLEEWLGGSSEPCVGNNEALLQLLKCDINITIVLQFIFNPTMYVCRLECEERWLSDVRAFRKELLPRI